MVDRERSGWEYACVGPADSFQGLIRELKAKAGQGWELSGVRNEASQVYATVKRRLAAAPARRLRSA